LRCGEQKRENPPSVTIIADSLKLGINWGLLANLLVSAILGGGISAAIVANIFAKRRDRENRRTEFLKKIGAWRTKVYRCQIPSKLSADFPKDVAVFGGEYIALERDLRGWQREDFHRLCDQIVAMTDSDVEQTAPGGVLLGKTQLLERIEKIISILERQPD
jgi:hypothetical protein